MRGMHCFARASECGRDCIEIQRTEDYCSSGHDPRKCDGQDAALVKITNPSDQQEIIERVLLSTADMTVERYALQPCIYIE